MVTLTLPAVVLEPAVPSADIDALVSATIVFTSPVMLVPPPNPEVVVTLPPLKVLRLLLAIEEMSTSVLERVVSNTSVVAFKPIVRPPGAPTTPVPILMDLPVRLTPLVSVTTVPPPVVFNVFDPPALDVLLIQPTVLSIMMVDPTFEMFFPCRVSVESVTVTLLFGNPAPLIELIITSPAGNATNGVPTAGVTCTPTTDVPPTLMLA